MIIDRIVLNHVVIPLKNPFTTSFGTVKDRHVVIGKFSSDIGETYAESPTLHAPMYTGETIDSVILAVRDHLGPSILGRQIGSPRELHETMAWVRGNAMAKHLIDTAAHHLFSAYEGVSLASYLGGRTDRVPVGLSIGIEKDHESMLERIAWATEQGFERVKIKIKPGHDIEPVSRVRDRFPDLPLMVDANAAYTIDDVHVFRALDTYDLMMIEQPFAEDDLYDHARLQKTIATPVCLDESISSPHLAQQARSIGACRIINIKPGRIGGFYPSLRLRDIARSPGEHEPIDLWIGGMAETSIGKYDAIALASVEGIALPSDIGPSSWYFAEDIVEPSYGIERGGIAVPREVGVGYTPREEIIERYTRSRVTITADQRE